MMAAIYEPRGMAREYAPLACNLYRGCTHGCTYCYAPGCLRMTPDSFHAESTLRKGILEDLRKEAPTYAGNAHPVLFSFTSDAYQPEETGDTREALKIMRDAGCPFQVLTKGGTRACRDFDLYGKRDAFGTTLAHEWDKDRALWEPNAATVKDRIAAIKAAHSLGIRTWVSIEPVIYPVPPIHLIESLSPWVDEWRVGKLNHHHQSKNVDWYDFADRVSAALEASGRDYMVKDALQPFLPKGVPTRRYAKQQPTVGAERQHALAL
jgi:DNA repair photolyase